MIFPNWIPKVLGVWLFETHEEYCMVCKENKGGTFYKIYIHKYYFCICLDCLEGCETA